MKRRDLLRHLEKNGCKFLREGGSHTIYVNRRAQKSSAIPRHREIIEFLAQRSVKIWTFPSRNLFLNRWEHSRGGRDWVDDIQGHVRGRVGRAWRTRQDVRKFAAQQKIPEEDALKVGLQEKAQEFVEKGAETYVR